MARPAHTHRSSSINKMAPSSRAKASGSVRVTASLAISGG